jgi:hypothetical protein
MISTQVKSHLVPIIPLHHDARGPNAALRAAICQWHWQWAVVMCWEGDSQATAPIYYRPQGQHERDACFGIGFRKRFVAFQPRIFFEFESFFFGIVVLF